MELRRQKVSDLHTGFPGDGVIIFCGPEEGTQ